MTIVLLIIKQQPRYTVREADRDGEKRGDRMEHRNKNMYYDSNVLQLQTFRYLHLLWMVTLAI